MMERKIYEFSILKCKINSRLSSFKTFYFKLKSIKLYRLNLKYLELICFKNF